MYLEQLSAENIKKQYDEFGVNDNTLKTDVESLRTYFAKAVWLPNIEDEEMLKHCLLRCKNSVEKTKNKLSNLYQMKANMPEIFDKRDPCSDDIVKTFDTVAFVPMPKLSPEGARVSVLKIIHPENYNEVSGDDFIKCTFMSAELRLKIDTSTSDILIFDASGMNLQIMAIVMSIAGKFITIGLKGFPQRLQAIYAINAPSAAEPLINLVKSFFRQDLLSRIHFLRDQSELAGKLPKYVLPKEYGGTEPSFTDLKDAWVKELQNHKSAIDDLNELKADLAKRPTSAASCNVSNGLEGSFRKINID